MTFRHYEIECEEVIAILNNWGCSNQDCKDIIGFNSHDVRNLNAKILNLQGMLQGQGTWGHW